MKEKRMFPYLTTRSLDPENQESPIHFLTRWQTPTKYFYRRNHFSYPILNQTPFWLQITNPSNQTRLFPFHEFLLLPSKTLVVPLECAGNKRSLFSPKVYGEQWQDGAMSQGKWTGVSLKDLLEQVGLPKSTKEIVFEGADFGQKPGISGSISFKRSLPIEKALHPDTIIAYQYNDKPLHFKHGFPFRLIVPNWYAMTSVKWLNRIRMIDHTFEGPFQTDDYVYYPHKDSADDSFPVTTLNVNSTIQQPLHYSILDTGFHQIKGIAWTGRGAITEVQVSFDKGETWENTTLYRLPSEHYAWVVWTFHWRVEEKGEYTILSRAKDSTGRIQPLTPYWNRKGYGYNAISKISIKVE